jgi:hypothetical protein
MTFPIARIAAAITGIGIGIGIGIGNKLCNTLDAALAGAITGIGNKLCNALDASLYHDWDLEDTPNDGADPLAEREAEAEVAGTPPTHPRKPTATNRQEARSP